MRRAEIAGLKVEDLDLEANVALVLGKGRRPRGCPFGRRTALAIDRYVRVRARHRDSQTPDLWLGLFGRMTDSGVAQMLERRAKKAGLPAIHAHLFRHTFAHQWLSQGGAGDGPDAVGGLAVETNAQPVCGFCCRRARQGGPSPSESG